MLLVPYLEIALDAYLLGSIPFGFLLVRLVHKQDIRSLGSGNIGATNVMRSGSKWLGFLTFLLDAGKGYVAVLVGAWMANAWHGINVREAAALAGLCAILGHIFPVWLGGKGGKGVATGFGMFLALLPWAALIAMAVFALTFAITRFVSLASIVASAALPLAGFLLYRASYTPWFAALVVAIAALIIAKHHDNIRRLLAGTEYRFGTPKSKVELQ